MNLYLKNKKHLFGKEVKDSGHPQERTQFIVIVVSNQIIINHL
jgi:hypothetical protein